MQKDRVKLSIIIPVYNCEKYLAECLEGIYFGYDGKKDFEVVVVDDGSSDGTSEIYECYAEKYDNLRYFKNKNSGVSHARNFGIDKSIGKYIMFVDGDDMLKKGWYDVILQDLERDDDLIFLSKYFRKDLEKDAEKAKVISYVTTYNDENIRISGPYSKLFKRAFLNESGVRFKEDIINGEDMLFGLESVCKSSTCVLERKSFYIVRHNGFSATSRFDERIIESEIRFNEELNGMLREYKFWDENIEKNSFLTSIRGLSLRVGRLGSFKEARKYYVSISKNQFYSEGLKKYRFGSFSGGTVFYYLFKHKWFFVLYYLSRRINKKNSAGVYEEL